MRSNTNTYKSVNKPYSNYSYKGSSGNKYQYDMNNPYDSMDYSTDIDAQRRDLMNPYNSGRNYDNSLGQFGTGIYE